MKEKTILIADDDEDIRVLLDDYLKKLGYKTLIAHNGIGAVESARQERPDLIIMDLEMPSGTGPIALMHLRSNPKTQKIPVIILTAMLDAGLKEDLERIGAQDFISKPYDMVELKQRIQLLLQDATALPKTDVHSSLQV